MAKYVNTKNIPIALGVFLASDKYDYNSDPFTISATTLLKPLRQIILSRRVPHEEYALELADQMKNRVGAAVHDAIESAWRDNRDSALEALGYPKRVIDKIKFNPTPEELAANPDIIPVYMEQRMSKKVGRWTVSGKFDFIGDGMVQDFKTTSTFTYKNQTNADKYTLQGSIYRWLDPQKITADVMQIHYIFTDWKQSFALSDPNYPKGSTHTQSYNLLSVEEMDRYVRNKLALLDKYMDAPEEEIPECDSEDLWQGKPVWKYYRSGNTTGRSTKNFDNAAEAYMRLAQDGHTGAVVEIPGSVKACQYCSAFPVCSQKDRLVKSGQLIL